MNKTCFVIVLLSVTCMAMPSRFRAKRSLWRTNLKRAVSTESPPQESREMYELLINEVYMYLGKSQSTGLTNHDLANFFQNLIGKDQQIARNFGVDYIFWGDQNGDHRLNRSELLRAMTIHKVFQYI